MMHCIFEYPGVLDSSSSIALCVFCGVEGSAVQYAKVTEISLQQPTHKVVLVSSSAHKDFADFLLLRVFNSS
jgi:hypothetical protein